MVSPRQMQELLLCGFYYLKMMFVHVCVCVLAWQCSYGITLFERETQFAWQDRMPAEPLGLNSCCDSLTKRTRSSDHGEVSGQDARSWFVVTDVDRPDVAQNVISSPQFD